MLRSGRGRMRRFVVVVALACASVAQAQNCERPPDASAQGVAGQSDEGRLAYLSKLLDEESGRARAWMGFWGGTYGLLTIAQLSLMPVFTREEQDRKSTRLNSSHSQIS